MLIILNYFSPSLPGRAQPVERVCVCVTSIGELAARDETGELVCVYPMLLKAVHLRAKRAANKQAAGLRKLIYR